MVSDLGCSTRNTSVNFDPSNFENFQAPRVDPLPRSDMNLCELSQTQMKINPRFRSRCYVVAMCIKSASVH